MRTCSRESAPAGCGCALSRARRRSCSASARPRFCAARSRWCTSNPSSGWPRPRNGFASPEPGLSSVNHRRDLREVPPERDRRDQRPGPRGGPGRRRHPRARRGLRPSAGRRDAAQTQAAAGRGAGGCRLLRPRRPGNPEVTSAAPRRSDVRVRNELHQVRRRRRGRVAAVPHSRVAHRAAKADRGNGRGRRRVPQRDRVPACRYREVQAGRASAVHRNGPGIGCSGHRRVARRSSGEDSVLERFQATRPMVGRAAALLVLGTALALYYAFHDRLWNASTWWDIAFIALVLIPACFALVWLVLPLRDMPGLLGVGLAFGVLAFLFHVAGWNTPENFCKLFGVTAVGFWFLRYFETLNWVVLVALIIPWVDAYSVWRGPTKVIVNEHRNVFTNFSFAFPIPGDTSAASLGLLGVAPEADLVAVDAVLRRHARPCRLA